MWLRAIRLPNIRTFNVIALRPLGEYPPAQINEAIRVAAHLKRGDFWLLECPDGSSDAR